MDNHKIDCDWCGGNDQLDDHTSDCYLNLQRLLRIEEAAKKYIKKRTEENFQEVVRCVEYNIPNRCKV